MPLFRSTYRSQRSQPARDYPVLPDGYKPRHNVQRDPPVRQTKSGAIIALSPQEVDKWLDSLDDFAANMEARWTIGKWPFRVQFGVDTIVGFIPGLGGPCCL